MLGLIRIGDKIVSLDKVEKTIERIIELRANGYSQQETAQKFNVDRSFISRLEKIGEIRKGKKIAVVGFPILNKEEILQVCREESVDFVLIMTEEERWDFLKSKSGVELFNELMQLIAKIREQDVVIVLASDKRAKLVRGLLEGEILELTLGKSPLSENQYVLPEQLKKLIAAAKEGRE